MEALDVASASVDLYKQRAVVLLCIARFVTAGSCRRVVCGDLSDIFSLLWLDIL